MPNGHRPVLMRICLAVLFLASAAAAPAQDQPLENRLPAKTTFYVSWHGSKPLAAARATNSILRLWDDSEFAAARAAMVAEMFASVPKDKKDKMILSREDVSSLLENPFVAGALIRAGSAAAPAAKAGKPNNDFDGFLIYDRTGKEEILARLMDLEKSGTPAPAITKSAFRDAEIETITSGPKKDTYYRSAAGRYMIVCQRREFLEELITRFAPAAASTESLATSAEHRAARADAKPGDALTFFFNLKALMAASKGTGPASATTNAVIHTMHLDSLESISSTVTFDGPTTRVRFAVLGDLSQGGLTDIIGAGAPNFSTMAAVPASATGFNSIRLDLNAFYRIVREGVAASVPAGQPNPMDAGESMVSAQIGMGLPEVMKLLSGEFAAVELEPGMDFTQKLFLISIDKPDDVLHLIRAMMTDSVSNEEQVGPVTYLAVLSPLSPKKAGTAAPSRKFWYVAVGPHLLVVAPRKAMARETMARFESTDHVGSLSTDPRFLAARNRLPQNLSGLSYSDLSKIDWTKLQKQVEEYSQTAATQAAADPNNPNQNQEVAKIVGEMWKQLPLQMLSRYIHSSYGGWWKDKHGVYFDSYME